MVTEAQIRKASKGTPNAANLKSVLASLEQYGADVGLDLPHRQAHYLAQLMHESGSFKWDQEIWGPTPAQKRYDTRTDLGNTPEIDGDGHLYRGRGAIQITGKSNYGQFRDWCRAQGYDSPDFAAKPDLVNTDPWEGLAPIWYWTTRHLNKWADQNDIETITKRINGGKNGLADRIDYYGRIALVLCGYEPTEDGVRAFQKQSGLDVDGDAGPKTRAALHNWLAKTYRPLDLDTMTVKPAPETRGGPVVEEKTVEKAVVPEVVEQDVKKKFNLFAWIGGLLSGGGLSLAGLAGMEWQAIVAIGGVLLFGALIVVLLRQQVIATIKGIREVVEA